MAIRLAPPATPRSPGYGRAFGRATVFGSGRAGAVPLPGAAVRAYVPGTDTPWPTPLYLDESATTPALFPVATDATGAVALWADAPGRVELSCTATGYAPQRVPLDLEPPPDAGDPFPQYVTDAELTTALGPYATDADLAAHAAAADPHPGYVQEGLLDAKGDLLAASAPDTPGRLALGTNGHVLTADSAQPLGIKWAAPPAGLDIPTADARYANVAGDTFTGGVTVTPPSGQRALTGNGDFGLLELGAAAYGTDLYIGSTRHYLLRDTYLMPEPSGAKSLGLPSNLWSAVWGNSLQAAGAAGTLRAVGFRTGASQRWSWQTTATAETGSNAGSDLELRRYSDAAADLGTALSLTRATGAATFGGEVFSPARVTANNVLINGGNPAVTLVGGATLFQSADGFTFRTAGGNIHLTPAAGYVAAENTDTTYLGHPSIRWKNVYATAVDVAGKPVAPSPDAGNALVWNANGFYVSSALTQTADDRLSALEARIAALEAA